jgi:hypothetical protein
MTLTGDGGCRSFTTELNSSWGLNVLDGLVTNDIGNEVALVQSYLRSGQYFPPPPASGSANRAEGSVVGISDAIRARLGQEAIDDGDRGDLDDLLSVINFALSAQAASVSAFLTGLIPNPLYDTISTTSHECLLQTRTNREGIIVRRNGSLNISGLRISELTAREGEIVVEVATGSISMPLSVAGYKDNACLGELTASASGSVGVRRSRTQITILVETVGDEVTFEVQFVAASVGSVVVDIESDGLIGWFGGFISAALSALGTVFVDDVGDALSDWAADELGTMVEEVVGMDKFAIGDLAAPLLDITVNVETETNLVKVGNGFIDYGVTATAYPTTYAKSPEERAAGSIIGSSTLPAFDAMNGNFGLGLKHDFINQVFWAYWAGGGFDFERGEEVAIGMLNDALPAEGVTVTSMEMTLPPVLMPGDTEEELKIGAGGIVLIADIEQSSPSLFAGQPSITVTRPLTVYLSVIFTVELSQDPESRGIRFDLLNGAEIDVEIVSAVRNDEIIELESMFGDTVEALVDALIIDVGISLPLPSLPIGTLPLDGLPPDLTWVLEDGVMDQVSGYLRLIGSVGVQE